jgi:Adenine deaminase
MTSTKWQSRMNTENLFYPLTNEEWIESFLAGDEDICTIINTLIQNKGGVGVVRDGAAHILPLPIAGLMTDKSAEQVATEYQELDNLAKSLGCTFRSPFITMAFMALPVIPELKITDKGLVDVNKFDFTNIEAE